MKKIVLDGFGGDHAPEEIVKGGLAALREREDFSLIITGDEARIRGLLSENNYLGDRIEIVPASEVITNDDVPTLAIRQKKDSSLVKAFQAVKEDPEAVGMVSAGSTGAVLTGGLFLLGRIRGINRPALCPVLPTATGGKVLLIDCGANVDCKPVNLCQFALMGSAYMRKVSGIQNPRVALLSNGTEDKKGNELNKEAFPLLKSMNGINFVGNMEARDVLSGQYDVVVTDGFAGNGCLKSLEGVAGFMMGMLKEEMMSSFKNKMGALLLKKSLKKVAVRLDYNKAGGALFLGVEKVLVKSHGASKEEAVKNSVLQALGIAESGLAEAIREDLERNLATGEQ